MAQYDVATIGAGPGGYVAAIRSAQLGLRVAVVERAEVGGICLNWGCIPSKALLKNAEVLSLFHNAAQFGITVEGVSANYAVGVERSRQVVERLTRGVESLFKKHNITLVQGAARFKDGHTLLVDGQELVAQNVIIATGARPKSIPGFEFDGEFVVSYREAIVQRDVPERVVIIGGGAIGVEFAYVYNAYGADVTIVEMEERLLPTEDEEMGEQLARSLTRQGINVYSGSTVTGLERHDDNRATVRIETANGAKELPTNRILMAVGIQANIEDLDLENAGVHVNEGRIQVDAELRASADGIYAIGDVTGIMALAHVAQAQGVYVAEQIAGEDPLPLDYSTMPRAVYCNPQVASVGITEQEARRSGIDYKVGKFPLIANGKALALGEAEGLAKLIIDSSTGELLGGHLIGHEVTEMIGELSLAKVLEGSNFEVGNVVTAHPTISEIVKEAALAADGKAIHI